MVSSPIFFYFSLIKSKDTFFFTMLYNKQSAKFSLQDRVVLCKSHISSLSSVSHCRIKRWTNYTVPLAGYSNEGVTFIKSQI